MNLLSKLKEILWKCEEEEKDLRLTARLEIRLTPYEKELFMKFADFQRMSMSDLIRTASNEYITQFIKCED